MGCKLSKVKKKKLKYEKNLQINSLTHFDNCELGIKQNCKINNRSVSPPHQKDQKGSRERPELDIRKNVSTQGVVRENGTESCNRKITKEKNKSCSSHYIENEVELNNQNIKETLVESRNENTIAISIDSDDVPRKRNSTSPFNNNLAVNANKQGKQKCASIKMKEIEANEKKGIEKANNTSESAIKKELDRKMYQQNKKEVKKKRSEKINGSLKKKMKSITENNISEKKNEKNGEQIKKKNHNTSEREKEGDTENEMNESEVINNEQINNEIEENKIIMNEKRNKKKNKIESEDTFKYKKRNKFEKKIFAGIAKTISRFPKRNSYESEQKDECKNKLEKIVLDMKKKDSIIKKNDECVLSNSTSKLKEKQYISSNTNAKDRKIVDGTTIKLNKDNEIFLYYHDFKSLKLKKKCFRYIYEFYKNNDNLFNLSSIMPNYLAINSEHSKIIFESSLIGKYVMLPWVENDPDIKNNLYLKYVLNYYNKKKNIDKACRYQMENQLTCFHFINQEKNENYNEAEVCLDSFKNDDLACSDNMKSHSVNVAPTHSTKTTKGLFYTLHESKGKKKKLIKSHLNTSFMKKKKSLHFKRKGSVNLSVDKLFKTDNASNSINSYRRYSSSMSKASMSFTWGRPSHWKSVSKKGRHKKKKSGRCKEGAEHIRIEKKMSDKLEKIKECIRENEKRKEKKRESEKEKEKKKEKKKEKLPQSSEKRKHRQQSSEDCVNILKRKNESIKKKKKLLHDDYDVKHVINKGKIKKQNTDTFTSKINKVHRNSRADTSCTNVSKELKNHTKKRKSSRDVNNRQQLTNMKKKSGSFNSLHVMQKDLSGIKKKKGIMKKNVRHISPLLTYGKEFYESKEKTYEAKSNDEVNRLVCMEYFERHEMFYDRSCVNTDGSYKKIRIFPQNLGKLKGKKNENGVTIDKNHRNTSNEDDNDKNNYKQSSNTIFGGDDDNSLKENKMSEISSFKECSHVYRLSENCIKRNFLYCEKCNKKRCVYHYLNHYKLYGWLNYKWTDPDGFLELSKRQQRKFFAWKRLSDIYVNPIVMTSNLRSNCIRQGFVADCSFLSSLTVLIEYERKHKIHVLSNIISPCVSNYLHVNKAWPVYNPCGMYICKLHCNGVQRKIIIDDYVPVKNNDSLLVAYSNNQQELWVTLLEKAFVKLMGGSYSMFGSNPGSDLYYLTGWIPITIPFKSKVSSSPPSMEKSIIHSRERQCFQNRRNKNQHMLELNCEVIANTRILKKKKILSMFRKSCFLNKGGNKNSYSGNSMLSKKARLNLDFYRILRNVNWTRINSFTYQKYEKWKTFWEYKRSSKKVIALKDLRRKSNRKQKDIELLTNFKKHFIFESNNVMDYSSYMLESNSYSKYGSRENSSSSISSNLKENSVTTNEKEDFQYDKKWDAIWKNIYDGIKKGKCVVCLGTLELEDAAPSGLDFPEGVSISTGIVTRHAYSILNIETYKEDKLLYVKNPWGCIRWKGKYSYQDEETWTKELQKKLNYSIDMAKSKDDGCFWIRWKDVIKHFSHIYICWNSSIFPYHVEIHAKWETNILLKSSILLDDTHLVAYNPQFALHINVKKQELSEDGLYYIGKKPIEVWILLSRHVKERKTDISQKYLALHVHSGKRRITCPLFPIKQGVYSNGECTFTKLVIGGAEEDNFNYGLRKKNSYMKTDDSFENLKSGESRGDSKFFMENSSISIKKSNGDLSQEGNTEYLRNVDFVLIVSQYSQKEEFNFTLKAFSHTPLSFYELPPLLSGNFESTYFKGKWTAKCAGGCSNNLWSYFKNPHIRLFVPEESTFTIFLECEQEHSVNLRIFKGMTSSPRTLKKGEVISSGAYRAGCCFIECTLEGGVYSIIPSLYKANTTGNYQICIHHSKKKKKPILYFIPYPYVIPPFSFFKHQVTHLYSLSNYSLIFFHITSVTLLSLRVIFQNAGIKGIPFVNIYKLIEDNTRLSTKGNHALHSDVVNGKLVHNNALKSKIKHNGCIYELVEKCNIHGSANNVLFISSCAYDYYVKFNSVFISLVELENFATTYMLVITTNLAEDVLSSLEAHFISDKPINVDSVYPSL